jgi:hypothetical protein
MADPTYNAVYLFKDSQCVLIDTTKPVGKRTTEYKITDVWPGLKKTAFANKVGAAALVPGTQTVVFVTARDTAKPGEQQCALYDLSTDKATFLAFNVFFNISSDDFKYFRQGIDAMLAKDRNGASYLFRDKAEARGTLTATQWNFSTSSVSEGANNFGGAAGWDRVDAALTLETTYLFGGENYYAESKSIGKIVDLWPDLTAPFDGSKDGLDAALALPTPKKANGADPTGGGNPGSTGNPGSDGGSPYQLKLPPSTGFCIAMVNNTDFARQFAISVDNKPPASGVPSMEIAARSQQVVSYESGSGDVKIRILDTKPEDLKLVGQTEQIGAGHYVNIGAQKPSGDPGYDQNDVVLTVYWPFVAGTPKK